MASAIPVGQTLVVFEWRDYGGIAHSTDIYLHLSTASANPVLNPEHELLDEQLHAIEAKLDIPHDPHPAHTAANFTSDTELAAQTTAIQNALGSQTTTLVSELAAQSADINNNTDARAAELDALLDLIEAKLDLELDETVSSRASQGSVDNIEFELEQVAMNVELHVTDQTDAINDALSAIEGKLDTRLNATVSSRATQTSVDALEVKLDNLAANLISHDGNLGQVGAALEAKLDAIEGKLDARLDATVSSRATPGDVTTARNNINANTDARAAELDTLLDTMELKLDARLDATVSSRATPGDVTTARNNINANTDARAAELDTLLDTIEAKLDARLDATVSSRATPGDVTTARNNINANTDARAAELDTLLDTIEAKLDARLDATVSSRATQTSVNTLAASVLDETDEIDAANAAIEGKLDLAAATTDVINDTFSALVGSVIEMKDVDLQVITVKNKKRYLLVATEVGMPVDVALLPVAGLQVSKLKNNPVTVVDVTSSTTTANVAGTGILDVDVDLPKSVKSAKLFQFNVVHVHAPDPILGPVAHFGSIVFKRGGDDDGDDDDD